MRSVLMHIYSMDVLAANVPSGMRTFVDDEASFALLPCEIGECRAKKSGSHYKIVILFHDKNRRGLNWRIISINNVSFMSHKIVEYKNTPVRIPPANLLIEDVQ